MTCPQHRKEQKWICFMPKDMQFLPLKSFPRRKEINERPCFPPTMGTILILVCWGTLLRQARIVYVGISCSPGELFQIIGAISQDQVRRQHQQQWLDPDISVRWPCSTEMAEIHPKKLYFFSYVFSPLNVSRASDARVKAMGPGGVEGASLGIQVRSLGA